MGLSRDLLSTGLRSLTGALLGAERGRAEGLWARQMSPRKRLRDRFRRSSANDSYRHAAHRIDRGPTQHRGSQRWSTGSFEGDPSSTCAGPGCCCNLGVLSHPLGVAALQERSGLRSPHQASGLPVSWERRQRVMLDQSSFVLSETVARRETSGQAAGYDVFG